VCVFSIHKGLIYSIFSLRNSENRIYFQRNYVKPPRTTTFTGFVIPSEHVKLKLPEKKLHDRITSEVKTKVIPTFR
jgi:hypothetical protein